MIAPAPARRPTVAITSRPSRPRAAGIRILVGGVLLTAATARAGVAAAK